MAKFNTRIVFKHDTQENWEKANGFIPDKGELIVYDADMSDSTTEKCSIPRIKMGDGAKNPSQLDFITTVVVSNTAPVAPDGVLWLDTSDEEVNE